MGRAHYSDDELAAFSAADKLGDGIAIPAEELRQLLNALASTGNRTREHLDRALQGLGESNKRKRENLRDVLKASQED